MTQNLKTYYISTENLHFPGGYFINLVTKADVKLQCSTVDLRALKQFQDLSMPPALLSFTLLPFASHTFMLINAFEGSKVRSRKELFPFLVMMISKHETTPFEA